MVVNWQDKAVQDRLLMSVIASVDNKVSNAHILYVAVCLTDNTD